MVASFVLPDVPALSLVRTAWQVFKLICTIIGYSCLGVAFWLTDSKRDFALFYKYGYFFAEAMLRLSGSTLEVQGYERLNENETYVFVANHTSLFDIPALWVAVGKRIRIRILYKRELESIPIFGWALRCSPFISIKRERPRDGMKRILEAAEAVRHGSSAVVFAEGTRSRTGKLQSFKRGAFTIAARSGKPIVPVSIIGSHTILPAGSLRLHPGVIRVVIGEPIQTSQYAVDDRNAEKALMHRVHEAVAAALPPEMRPEHSTVP